MNKPYDSEQDTKDHIALVQGYLAKCCEIFLERGRAHDQSKLEEPEKSLFDKYRPMLAALDYGSPEYRQSLDSLRPALTHHYQANSHHPEHYGWLSCNGCHKRFPIDYDGRCDVCGYSQFQLDGNVDGMNLFDVLEMFIDWKASGEQHDSGSIAQSLKVNTDRFRLSPQLASILWNTAVVMGWASEEERP